MRGSYYYSILDSTMSELQRLRALGGRDDRNLVRCETQSGGAGRGTNRWHSPAGGLWLTFDLAWPASVPSFALYIGRCAHLTITELFQPQGLSLKWPNDIWLGDRKLGGILCSHIPAESLYLIGIGINTNVISDNVLLEYDAAILSDHLGFAISNSMLAELLARRALSDLALLAEPAKYLDYCSEWLYGVGCEAELTHAGGVARGRISGLAEDGSLLMQSPEGSFAAFSQGSLKILSRQA